jgi:transposase InsO family protein
LFCVCFAKWGFFRAIRTDNGAPFASTGIHGLCELDVGWMRLRIVRQHIRPSRPQEDGQHERMHRDLKRETTRPPAANLRGLQRRFDRFRHRYHEERPHDGIDQRTGRITGADL